MRQLFIMIMIALSGKAAYAQGVADEKMNAKINELNKAGVDTIMVYGPTGGGVRTYFDNSPCYVYHNERYLVWIYKKHNYITLVDECYEYKVLKDKLKQIQDLLGEHLTEIIQEKIKHGAVKMIVNGKEELETWSTSDDIYYRFTFNVKGHNYVKSFGSADLTTKYGPGGDDKDHLNIYYDQNQKTYLKQLHDAMNQYLPTLKIEKKK